MLYSGRWGNCISNSGISAFKRRVKICSMGALSRLSFYSQVKIDRCHRTSEKFSERVAPYAFVAKWNQRKLGKRLLDCLRIKQGQAWAVTEKAHWQVTKGCLCWKRIYSL